MGRGRLVGYCLVVIWHGRGGPLFAGLLARDSGGAAARDGHAHPRAQALQQVAAQRGHGELEQRLQRGRRRRGRKLRAVKLAPLLCRVGPVWEPAGRRGLRARLRAGAVLGLAHQHAARAHAREEGRRQAQGRAQAARRARRRPALRADGAARAAHPVARAPPHRRRARGDRRRWKAPQRTWALQASEGAARSDRVPVRLLAARPALLRPAAAAGCHALPPAADATQAARRHQAAAARPRRAPARARRAHRPCRAHPEGRAASRAARDQAGRLRADAAEPRGGRCVLLGEGRGGLRRHGRHRQDLLTAAAHLQAPPPRLAQGGGERGGSRHHHRRGPQGGRARAGQAGGLWRPRDHAAARARPRGGPGRAAPLQALAGAGGLGRHSAGVGGRGRRGGAARARPRSGVELAICRGRGAVAAGRLLVGGAGRGPHPRAGRHPRRARPRARARAVAAAPALGPAARA
mmetsp:Transcript_26601/g.67505  ORF Transcript_26601/g.67505 Transcript_26601/m.67505 type:complete len:464 (-) Transcript_26601:2959-4350(-)